jgi:hypothetical protein
MAIAGDIGPVGVFGSRIPIPRRECLYLGSNRPVEVALFGLAISVIAAG